MGSFVSSFHLTTEMRGKIRKKGGKGKQMTLVYNVSSYIYNHEGGGGGEKKERKKELGTSSEQ